MSLPGCVCFAHSDDLLPVLLAGAGPPSFDGLLFKQRHQFVHRLLQKLQVTFLWRLGRTQHVVQVHHQVTYRNIYRTFTQTVINHDNQRLHINLMQICIEESRKIVLRFGLKRPGHNQTARCTCDHKVVPNYLREWALLLRRVRLVSEITDDRKIINANISSRGNEWAIVIKGQTVSYLYCAGCNKPAKLNNRKPGYILPPFLARRMEMHRGRAQRRRLPTLH